MAVAGTVACMFLSQPWKVAVANMPTRIMPGILHFQPDLRGADVGIENRADIADPPGENAVRIGVQLDVGKLAHVHVLQIVFKDIADNPDVRKIGNRERVGRR